MGYHTGGISPHDELNHVLISPETYSLLMIRMSGASGHTRACQRAGGVTFDGSRCICGIYRVQQELLKAPRVHPRDVDYVTPSPTPQALVLDLRGVVKHPDNTILVVADLLQALRDQVPDLRVVT